MKALGCHIVAELSHCDAEIITDLDLVRDSMVRAAELAKAEVREVAFHRFIPHGVSGVVVISESHLSIHTWPELGYAAVDIYTCGNTADPWLALRYLAEQFQSQSITASVIERGSLTATGAFSHNVTPPEEDVSRAAKSA